MEAPHNAILNILITKGLFASITFALFNISIVYKSLKVHYNRSKMRTSALIVSSIVSIFVLGLVSNFLNLSATGLAYIFYSASGVYINATRKR